MIDHIIFLVTCLCALRYVSQNKKEPMCVVQDASDTDDRPGALAIHGLRSHEASETALEGTYQDSPTANTPQ
jgi:hypothetical protein